MLDMFVSRARFHLMVWSNPRAALMGKLRIHDKGFLKLCHENRIPVPQDEAWSGSGSGSQHFRMRLPRRELGENAFLFFTGDFTRKEQGSYLQEMLSEPLDDLDDMTARFRKRLRKINEHDDPFRLHDAFAGLIHSMPSAANDDAVMDAYRAEQRRLNLLNEIFLYAEALGGRCRFGGPQGREHAVRIGHMNVRFTLDSFDRTDRLRLAIVSPHPPAGVRQRWEDTASVTLENILPDLMVGMGLIAEAMCRQERDSWNSEEPVVIGDRLPLTHALHG